MSHMRIIVRSPSEDTYALLVKKIKSSGIEICKENKKWNFVSIKVPKTRQEIFYDLLEIGGTVERDVKNDLD